MTLDLRLSEVAPVPCAVAVAVDFSVHLQPPPAAMRFGDTTGYKLTYKATDCNTSTAACPCTGYNCSLGNNLTVTSESNKIPLLSSAFLCRAVAADETRNSHLRAYKQPDGPRCTCN